LKIIFACGAMPFGPNTPTLASLGGSETACLMLAKAVADKGHDVTLFCNLPPQGAPDFFPSGNKADDGVRYVSLEHFAQFATTNVHDVLIAMRDPKIVSLPTLSKKKVLWMHDIATKRGYGRQFDQMIFTFDEIWAVSEWHKDQIATTTGYPEDRIVALRNGIVDHADVICAGRIPGQILYASRPERGLENLIKPGGIMEHLPEFTLTVAMYEHFPEHMREYYSWIMHRMSVMPNVNFVGGKPNAELRQMISDSAAYIYPTQFEETSCILARECMEQHTPFLTTSVGALPETLGDNGIFFEDWLYANGVSEPERGGPGWCKLFAQFFRESMQNNLAVEAKSSIPRDDLYWDGVAEMIEPHLRAPRAANFSRIGRSCATAMPSLPWHFGTAWKAISATRLRRWTANSASTAACARCRWANTMTNSTASRRAGRKANCTSSWIARARAGRRSVTRSPPCPLAPPCSSTAAAPAM
jgi:glycosyltransferase involved in cell wall biosynthesis